MIPACRLWEKVSAKGNPYLIGRLGGARVLILANTWAEPGDDSTHTLFLTDAPQRNPAAQANVSRRDDPPNDVAPAEPSQPTSRARRSARHAKQEEQIEDDPMPF